jgi:hypothetical protein
MGHPHFIGANLKSLFVPVLFSFGLELIT